jgi:hypothetical protein
MYHLVIWMDQTFPAILLPGMPCIRLLLLEVKKNVQQCPNTSVTMHLPTLKLVTLSVFGAVPTDPMHSVRKGVMA